MAGAPDDFSWKNILSYFLSDGHCEKISEMFSALSTAEERIEFLLNSDCVVREVRGWISRSRGRNPDSGKSSDVSLRMRQAGNEAFQRKNYEVAAENYTQSILYAPQDTPEGRNLLSLGNSNRSAALFFLGRYQACLDDIDRSLDEESPPELRWRLLMRKVDCLAAMGRTSEASRGLKDASLAFETHPESDGRRKESMRERMSRLRLKVDGGRSACSAAAPEPNLPPPPPLSHGSNPVLAFASAGLDVRYDQLRGRHVVANRLLAAGDVLFVERPFASVLLPPFYASHCHHCHDHLSAVIPCCSCSRVRYCSEACRSDSWRVYHRVECGHLDLLHAIGLGHLVLRIVLVAGVDFLLSNREKIEAAATLRTSCEGGHSASVRQSGYEAVLALVTHSEETDPRDMLSYALTSCLLLLLLDDAAGQRPLTSDERRSVGAVMLRHTLQLICNAHAIVERRGDGGGDDRSSSGNAAVEDETEECVATAIYPSASLMNHSCQPSILASFYGNVLVVKAVADVPVGGEIFNCYGPHHARMGREKRQRCLRQQYFFTCRCVRCEGDDGGIEVAEAYRCPSCDGPVAGEVCGQCSRVERPSASAVQDYERSVALFKSARELDNRCEYKDALLVLETCLGIREKILFRFNRELGETFNLAARCCASMGMWQDSVDYLRRAVAVADGLYGAESIEAANELQMFTDVLWKSFAELDVNDLRRDQASRVRVEEAWTAAQRGLKIFNVHYDASHPAARDMAEKMQYLQIFKDLLAIA